MYFSFQGTVFRAQKNQPLFTLPSTSIYNNSNYVGCINNKLEFFHIDQHVTSYRTLNVHQLSFYNLLSNRVVNSIKVYSCQEFQDKITGQLHGHSMIFLHKNRFFKLKSQYESILKFDNKKLQWVDTKNRYMRYMPRINGDEIHLMNGVDDESIQNFLFYLHN